MEKLTDKQSKILNAIKKFIAEKGYAPTIRELCDLCNLSSTATMFVHLKNLTNKGYINQTENKFRTIELNVPNEYFSIPKELLPKNHEVFALEVSGESMINVGIFDGDIVIVQREKDANNGEIVVAMTEDNEVTLKRFYKERDHIRLQPENDTMNPIILNNCSILGKAIGLYRNI